MYTSLRLIVAGLLLSRCAAAADEPGQDLGRQFEQTVRPFVQTYCQSCHGAEKSEAKLNLASFATTAQVASDHRTWQTVMERLEAREMPPEDAKRQPTEAQQREIIEWIRAFRKHEAQRNAGDPGLVLARRLTSAEYNYSIRDLTGVDIRPAQEFPVDPANEAGFDNSAESLTMSPALLQKYLDAARLVADHLVLKPDGLAFAPHPVVTDTDRDKYCVKRIVEFYQRQPTDYENYFYAAWRYRHRESLGRPEATPADIAAEDNVSPKYLTLVWSTLTDSPEAVGPIAKLQAMWRELPSPEKSQPDVARPGCEQMRDYVVRLRAKLEPNWPDLQAAGIHKGSQCFVLWKNRQYAAHRRSYNRGALHLAGADSDETEEDDPTIADLTIPTEADRPRYEAAFTRFCSVFPDAFYISERGRDYVGKPKDQQEKGRLLSAGFHSMMGYFRDDGPLCELVLDDGQRAELDALWRELDFITSAPMRQYSGFLWFERTDSRYLRDEVFDFARAEDMNAASEEMVKRLGEAYLAKALENGAEGTPVEAIVDYFDTINAQIRWVERARRAAEPSHVAAVIAFAERAFRRPLSQVERDDLHGFYSALRQQDELSHEEAVQDVLVSVLMSPHFLYRMDLAAADGARRPLTDYELASRLSYFLWASVPDVELLASAAAGELHRPEELLAQTRRMLKDDRVRGLAVEFGANWFDIRRL